MSTQRPPAVAGRFYPGEHDECERSVDELLREVPKRAAIGAVAPHAGWVYSGATAALAIAGISGRHPGTIVIFGSVHVQTHNEASLYPTGSWRTPLGDLSIDEDLAARIAGCRHVVSDVSPHTYEHSIEVQLPFIKRLIPGVMIVPIMVRPGAWAVEVGRDCARAARELHRKAVFLGSTDLTHYGPAFGFEPHGRGEEGVRWAKEVNDRRMIRLIQNLDGDSVVTEAVAHYSACGAGAIAATIGACVEAGAVRYEELRHTTSAELERERGLEPVNSVGYEAGLFLES